MHFVASFLKEALELGEVQRILRMVRNMAKHPQKVNRTDYDSIQRE